MFLRTALGAAALASLLATSSAAQAISHQPDFMLECVTSNPIYRAAGSHLSGTPASQTAAYWSVFGVASLEGGWYAEEGSDDGSVFIGRGKAPPHGPGTQHSYWTAATGWQLMPPLAGTSFSNWAALDVSDDGSVLVGSGGSQGNGFGVRWDTSGDPVPISDPALAQSLALCVSGDGTRLGGWVQSFAHTEHVATVIDETDTFYPVLPSLVWPTGTLQPSELLDLDHDGTMGVGDVGNEAFIWSLEQGAQLIPRPAAAPGDAIMQAVGIAGDGRFAYGNAYWNQESHAFLWTADQGTRLLSDLALQLMLDVNGYDTPVANVRDVRADGLLVGGRHGSVNATAFRMSIPPAGVGEVIDLGLGTPGPSVTPTLAGFGSFAPNTPARVSVGGVTWPFTIYVVVGFSRADVPLKGGVLVPSPDVILPFTASAAQALSIDFTWPAGVPSGASTWVQAWTSDFSAPAGFASSNAVQLVTP